jgi:hypothetical protein
LQRVWFAFVNADAGIILLENKNGHARDAGDNQSNHGEREACSGHTAIWGA